MTDGQTNRVTWTCLDFAVAPVPVVPLVCNIKTAALFCAYSASTCSSFQSATHWHVSAPVLEGSACYWLLCGWYHLVTASESRVAVTCLGYTCLYDVHDSNGPHHHTLSPLAHALKVHNFCTVLSLAAVNQL